MFSTLVYKIPSLVLARQMECYWILSKWVKYKGESTADEKTSTERLVEHSYINILNQSLQCIDAWYFKKRCPLCHIQGSRLVFSSTSIT